MLNATFYSFTRTGEWFAAGRGVLPRDIFDVDYKDSIRKSILRANNNKFPGTSGPTDKLTLVVIPDEKYALAHPLLLRPER